MTDTQKITPKTPFGIALHAIKKITPNEIMQLHNILKYQLIREVRDEKK